MIKELDDGVLDLVCGGGALAGVAATAGVISGGAAMMAPFAGPGALAFGFVAGAMGLLAIGAGYADSYYS